MLMVGPCQGHRRQEVKADLSIWFGVCDWFASVSWSQRGVVRAMVLECPRLSPTSQPDEESCVHQPTPVAQGCVEGWSHIADLS